MLQPNIKDLHTEYLKSLLKNRKKSKIDKKIAKGLHPDIEPLAD